MERWDNCPGSVRLCATVPNTSSSYAEEGTKAHDYAAAILGTINNSGVIRAITVCIPDDMREAVKVYVDHVHTILTPSDTLLVEHGFHLKQIHPDCYGTADAVIWKPYSKHLHVIDYKHGAGKPVEVKDNKQLRYYALGALLSLGYNAKEVTVTIVQPRCEHEDGQIRSETFAAFDLIEWAADLRAAVVRTEDPNAPLVPGAHCRATFCPAQAVCPALTQRTQEMAALEFSPVAAYEPEKLAQALAFASQAEAWAKAVREFAYAEAMRGKPIPGFKLVAKRAHRSWKDEQALLTWLERRGDLALAYEPAQLKSPAQLEKLLNKPDKAKMGEFTIKESSGNTLAPVDDARPEVRLLDAAAAFAEAGATPFPSLTEA